MLLFVHAFFIHSAFGEIFFDHAPSSPALRIFEILIHAAFGGDFLRSCAFDDRSTYVILSMFFSLF